MNIESVVSYLMERDNEADCNAKVFADRLLMRIFNVTSLLSYLEDVVVLPSKDEQKHRFQLKFKRLPPEIVPQVVKLIAMPNVKTFEFSEGSHLYTGFEVTADTQDLVPSDSAKKHRS